MPSSLIRASTSAIRRPVTPLGAVRPSIGEATTDDEIRQAGDALVTAWRSLLSS